MKNKNLALIAVLFTISVIMAFANGPTPQVVIDTDQIIDGAVDIIKTTGIADTSLSNVVPATGRAALELGTMAVATATDYVATDTFTGHTGATGASVHGLGTIATVDSPVPIANGGTGATTAAAGLAALGGASLNGSSTVDFSVNHVKAADGIRDLPSFSFASDPDTGVYRSSENTLALTASGAVGLLTSGGNTAIGATPSTSFRLRIGAFPENHSALNLTSPNPAVTVDGTNYKQGLSINSTLVNIATGVVDSGYRIGVGVESYITDANFQGTLDTQTGIWCRTGIHTSGTGTVINSYGLRLQTLNTAGTISNIWGIYQETAAARNYFAGRTLFGTTTDDGVSAVQVAGGGLRLVGSSAPATPAEGTLYFNSADKHFYGWNGTAWVQLDN